MTIYEKLLAIQLELKAPKNQYNDFGKYKYRSAEDILEALKPLCKKHKVVVFTTELICGTLEYCAKEGDKPLVYVESTAFMRDLEGEGSINVVSAAFIDFEAKGMQMPQRTGAASSYAKKYSLNNLLLIDDTKDPDITNAHDKGSRKVATKLPPAAPSLKIMTGNQKESLSKGVAEGKFDQVEKYLKGFKSGTPNYTEIEKELADAKGGKIN